MARGAKYSQAFRNGGQYYFSGRFIVKSSEVAEHSYAETANQHGYVVISRTLAETQSQELAKSYSSVRSSSIAELELTNAPKSRGVNATGSTPLAEQSSGSKQTNFIVSVSNALVEKSVSLRNVAVKRTSATALHEATNAVKYYFKYSAPIQFIFGTKYPTAFEEKTTQGTFETPSATSYSTGVSTETFHEDGVSSYEDGQ